MDLLPPLKPALRGFASSAFALIALAACGGDDTESEPTTDAGVREGPLYAVSHTVESPDNDTSYVSLVDSLAAGTTIDTRKSLEFAGGARAYGLAEANAVYVTSSEEPTLTEVTFDSDGSPRKGRTLSFAKLGLDSTTGGNVFVHLSRTKAYFVSQVALEIVVWNPEAMEIVKTVPLEIEPPPDYPEVYFYPRPILVDDQLVLVSSRGAEVALGPGVVVTVVDTEKDRVVSSTTEPRCHSMLQSGVSANGDRYFASSDYAAALHLITPEESPAPCMLRMRAGATEFDPEWNRSLSDELATTLWTGVTQGANGRVYVQSTSPDTDAIRAAAEEGGYEVTIAQPWNWYALSGPDAQPERIETGLEYPPTFAPIPVEDHDYVAVSDDVETTLVDLSAGDKPEPRLVAPGFVYNVVKVR